MRAGAHMRLAEWLRARAARAAEFRVGDPVIFRAAKVSAHPGPRAVDVAPAPRGESYSYVVDKLWRVEEVLADGRLVLATRRGKRHTLEATSRQLRHPSWLERWRYRDRFPAPPAPPRALRPVR
ncbi:MAG: hypothetical protein R3E88_18580 [Myxococcota bacterium]